MTQYTATYPGSSRITVHNLLIPHQNCTILYKFSGHLEPVPSHFSPTDNDYTVINTGAGTPARVKRKKKAISGGKVQDVERRFCTDTDQGPAVNGLLGEIREIWQS